MAERQYVGKGKIIGKFGQIKIGLRVADLKPNEKGWVNLIISQMKEKDKYENTHTVFVDDWQPGGQQSEQQPGTDSQYPEDW